MASDQLEGMDEIDRMLLRILAKDPRAPYSDIADELEERGYEMSSEGIRYRVKNIFNKTSIFFLLSPEEHNWEIVRLAVSAVDEEGAKEALFEELSSMRFWLVCRGIGTYDAYAIASAESTQEVDELVTRVEELDEVDSTKHSIETDRRTDVDDYLATQRDDAEG